MLNNNTDDLGDDEGRPSSSSQHSRRVALVHLGMRVQEDVPGATNESLERFHGRPRRMRSLSKTRSESYFRFPSLPLRSQQPLPRRLSPLNKQLPQSSDSLKQSEDERDISKGLPPLRFPRQQDRIFAVPSSVPSPRKVWHLMRKRSTTFIKPYKKARLPKLGVLRPTLDSVLSSMAIQPQGQEEPPPACQEEDGDKDDEKELEWMHWCIDPCETWQ